MPNSTCRLLSNGYKFDYHSNGTLRLRPCCLFSDSVEIDIHNDDNEQIEKYRDRISQLDSYQHDGCNQCNFFEKNNLRKTWRQVSFDIVPDTTPVADAVYLEIQIDNVCNGGCIICGPQHSSYWQNQLDISIPIKSATRNSYIDRILKIVDIQKTRKILFLGGEPFLSDVDQQLLPLIQNPELVDIQYTTNSSIYPSQDRIEYWKKFKSVLINFSIDGIGDKFEYIRYPLKWNIVQHNMFRMREQLPNNVSFKINHTVNVLNLFYHDEFDRWQKTNFSHDKHGKEIKYTFNPAAGLLDPRCVTEEMRALVLEKFGVDSTPYRTIRNVCPSNAAVINYLQQLDSKRKLDWRDVFREISNFV